jgi:hypothetical protein
MAKKITRVVPVMKLNIIGGGEPSVEMLCDNEVFSNAVYIETIESIKEAIKTKSKTAILFKLDTSEYQVVINKDQWKQALQSCLDVYIDREQYEICSKIKILIDKI